MKKEIEKFIVFLKERPMCNQRCSTISNIRSIEHEISYSGHYDEHSKFLLAWSCARNQGKNTLLETIRYLKERLQNDELKKN